MTGSLQIKKDSYYAVLNFYTTDGKRVPKWISTGYKVSKNTKRKATAMLNQLLVEYEGREVLDERKNMRVSDFAWEWLEEVRPTIEDSTYDNYFSNILHVQQYFQREENAKLCVDELTKDIIEDFYKFLLREGKLVHRKGDSDPGLCRKYVKDIAKNFRRMLDYAHDKKVVFAVQEENPNPARLVTVPKKPEPIKTYGYFEGEDFGIFMKAIKGHVLEDFYMVSLFYGLRRSEALGLCWGAVNMKKRCFTVKRTVVRNRRLVEKDRTKNKSSNREYPIPDFIYEILVGIRAKQEENRRLFGAEYYESDYVFTWDDGRPFSPDYPTKTFKRIVKKTEGLDPNMRLHDLRASCVTMLAEAGYTLKEVQKWVGHAENSEETMKVYMRVRSNIKNEIGADLGSKFRGFSEEGAENAPDDSGTKGIIKFPTAS